MPTRNQRELETLTREALAAADAHYANALAEQVENRSGDEHWRQLYVTLTRTLLVSGLLGVAHVSQNAKVLGADLVFDDEPFPVPAPDAAAFGRFNIETLDPSEDFVTGTFAEALEDLRSRVPRLRTTVDSLRREAQALALAITRAERGEALARLRERSRAIQEALRRSFWASDVGLQPVINLRSLLADALRGVVPDETVVDLPEFIDLAQLSGARNLTRARLETVYRNGLNQSYNRGQAEILRAPEVRPLIPLAMIDEIRDDRTRETHAAVDGYINTIEEIDRQGVRPPAGHNCRGSLRAVPRHRARQLDLLDENGNPDPARIRAYNGERQAVIDRGEYPDEGWAA